MKVLHLNTFDDPADGSGAERIQLAIAREFCGRKIDNVMVGTKPDGIAETFIRESIKIWRVPLSNIYWPARTKQRHFSARRIWHLLDSYNFEMGKKLDAIIEVEKPDACIIHGLSGWSIAAIRAISNRKIPSIQVLHDFYYACPNTIMRSNDINCERQCIGCRMTRLPHRDLSNRLSAVVGVSEFVLKKYGELNYFSKVGLKRVIHNAAIIPHVQSQKTHSTVTSRPKVPVRYGFIGTIAPHKGIELLLECFCNNYIGRAQLLIAGQGKPDYVRGLRERWGQSGVEFLGQVDPSSFFREVDFCVVPSLWYENFPGVICESFYFGVPVIASDRGGIPEIVINDVNGYLFNPDDKSSLRAVLNYSLNATRDKYAELALCAKETGNRFSLVRSWIDQYESLLSEVLR